MEELNIGDVYFTTASVTDSEIKIKGSRFIANVCSANSKSEAEFFLEQIRKQYYNATHNCFAYRIGYEGMEYRFSDDGEPNGTGGKPILYAIKKSELSDIIVVVTRYFGGTKLGIGPLARAYSEAAQLALDKTEKKPVYRTMQVKVFCTYEDFQAVKKLTGDIAVGVEEFFSDSIELIVQMPISKVDYYISKINSITNGRAGAILAKS
ncbi:MAG: hypothetical protein QG635_2212 [Bacteroidota bacterium]|nr:hypothetical protein [Bacteroidota bacterium]